jgi:hypothetical protein
MNRREILKMAASAAGLTVLQSFPALPQSDGALTVDDLMRKVEDAEWKVVAIIGPDTVNEVSVTFNLIEEGGDVWLGDATVRR